MIYLDNAATTKLHPKVEKAIEPYLKEYYGNPSSVYRFGQSNRNDIEKAREEVAAVIHAKPEEIYFTGGGSESDNWALVGVAEGLEAKGKHIITTNIEHHAVLHTCQYLETRGFEVTYLEVDETGKISLEKLETSIRSDTILISIMAANNEIGTIQPIQEIGTIARAHSVLFHTDGVQAFGHIKIDVEEMKIDLLSASGHKIYGPKGVGFLYVRKGIPIQPLIHGGAQERGKRAGTHNVPGIIGLGAAAKLAEETMKERISYEIELRDYAIERIQNEIPYSILNGDVKDRLPNNIHFCFRFIEGESLLIMLDQKGICASSGSACTSGSLDPSHVLLAIGRPHEIAHGSLRLTISEETKREEINTVIDSLKAIVERLRGMSPLYEDFLNRDNKEEM